MRIFTMLALVLQFCLVVSTASEAPFSLSLTIEMDSDPSINPCEEHYLALPDDDLWKEVTKGNYVGDHCQVHIEFGGHKSCNYYAKGAPDPRTGNDGIPRKNAGHGTGCIKDDTSRFCYLTTPLAYQAYNLTFEERVSMCTEDVIANGAAQIRHGILNGLCMDEGKPLTCQLPVSKKVPTYSSYFSTQNGMCRSIICGFILLLYAYHQRSAYAGKSGRSGNSSHLDIHYHSSVSKMNHNQGEMYRRSMI